MMRKKSPRTIEVEEHEWQSRAFRHAVMVSARWRASRERAVYRIVKVLKPRGRQLLATVDGR